MLGLFMEDNFEPVNVFSVTLFEDFQKKITEKNLNAKRVRFILVKIKDYELINNGKEIIIDVMKYYTKNINDETIRIKVSNKKMMDFITKNIPNINTNERILKNHLSNNYILDVDISSSDYCAYNISNDNETENVKEEQSNFYITLNNYIYNYLTCYCPNKYNTCIQIIMNLFDENSGLFRAIPASNYHHDNVANGLITHVIKCLIKCNHNDEYIEADNVKVIINEKFRSLSDEDKISMLLAICLHDYGKVYNYLYQDLISQNYFYINDKNISSNDCCVHSILSGQFLLSVSNRFKDNVLMKRVLKKAYYIITFSHFIDYKSDILGTNDKKNKDLVEDLIRLMKAIDESACVDSDKIKL